MPYSQKEKKLDKPVSVKLQPSTYEAINKIAEEEDRTISYVIEKSIRKALKLKD